MMEAVEDADGYFAAEMVACGWCRFYHHTGGDCRRHAPSPEYDLIKWLVHDYLIASGKKEVAEEIRPLNTYWPSVDMTDACGDFERGAGFGAMTIEEQRRLFGDLLAPLDVTPPK
jgi:hypothetical protein